MAFKFQGIPKVFFFIAAALYPALIFYFLVIRKIPLRLFSLFVVVFALLVFIRGEGLNPRPIPRENEIPRRTAGTRSAARYFITGTSRKKETKGISFFWNSALLLGLGVLCFIINSAVILKLYPLLMNILFLAAFGGTLFFPPSMIFRFATMQDKSIAGSLNEKRIAAYCRTVTYVWCGFFVCNGSIAAWTIFSGSDTQWSVYNGLISYILIGVLFAGEFMVRKMVQKKMPKSVPLSTFRNNDRPLSTILCYEGAWSDNVHKTWGDFLEGAAELRRSINAADGEKWLLHCEDYWYFLLAFTALLQCKKEILLSANVSPAYIAEIRDGAAAQSAAPFMTDQVFPEGECPPNTFYIPSLLKAMRRTDSPAEEGPAINADKTSIIMYTSGSTGKPKAVRQRLTEFEADNRFIISQWGDEFLKRALCSTVSQHHIYGLLFSIFLPFTLGVPFRRKRIEFPEEMEKLSDREYMIITVPAFLKRAVEMEKSSGLNLKSPWIFTSGGALNFETAQKTNEVFGFWPVEVYGSTETSGIAWRQSVNGPEWTVFDNAQISQNRDGCLIIRSPYIKDPAGFETADMVELLEDGRFLLKGRIDSVVKIEEKRISFPEIESRILQSGLASDVCVISLEDKRQYLAAAMVFNNKGKERFDGLEKHEINTFWREYLLQYFENIVIPKKWRYLETLPLDAQGKKKKEDIQFLFSGEKEDGINANLTTEDTEFHGGINSSTVLKLRATPCNSVVKNLKLEKDLMEDGINANLTTEDTEFHGGINSSTVLKLRGTPCNSVVKNLKLEKDLMEDGINTNLTTEDTEFHGGINSSTVLKLRAAPCNSVVKNLKLEKDLMEDGINANLTTEDTEFHGGINSSTVLKLRATPCNSVVKNLKLEKDLMEDGINANLTTEDTEFHGGINSSTVLKLRGTPCNSVVKNLKLESDGFGKLDREKIIEKTENTVSLEFSIPDTSPYFDGHFPGFPILPAVAQAELIIRFAARHLGTGIESSQMRRIKFTNFIRPDTPLLLKLTKNEKTISFNFSSPEGETVYSAGTIITGIA